MALQITTPPPTEPVTTAEVKARLRLTTTADDSTIASNIVSAREYAEKVTRRSLAYKSYAYFLDRFPCPGDPIRLPVPPLISVTAIKYFDSTLTLQTWDAAEYFVAPMQSPGLIITKPGFIYPCPGDVPGAVEIDFASGYGYLGDAQATPPIAAGPVCPEHLKEGIRQLAVHIYEHPSAVTPEGLKEAPLALMSFFLSNKFYCF